MYSPPVVLWSGSCGGISRGLERRFLERFYGEFMLLGGYRHKYGLFPDWWLKGERGELRTRSADA